MTRSGAAANNTSEKQLKHPWLFALPGGCLPQRVDCAGMSFDLVETFKHDFFAATGLYRGPDRRLAVLKVGRQTRLAGLPMTAIGQFLRDREVRLYAELQGTPGVPALIGSAGETGFMHAFVPGHALGRREDVGDAFFDQLEALLRAVHSRHIAYVDLNKRQNILMGEDGQPYLIDFQISLHLRPRGWGRLAPAQWLLRRFQQADWYHFLKHKRRLRPDLLTPEERARVERLSVWIRLHRVIARPLTNLRRRMLARLGRGEANVAGSGAK